MFFVIRIKTANDGTSTKSVYEFTNYTDALKQYYSTLSGDIGSDLQSNLCMLISANGNVIENKYFKHGEEE